MKWLARWQNPLAFAVLLVGVGLAVLWGAGWFWLSVAALAWLLASWAGFTRPRWWGKDD